MRTAIAWVGICFAGFAEAAEPSFDVRKHALVLANDAPRGAAIEKKLAALGFRVRTEINPKEKALQQVLGEYAASLSAGDVGFVFDSRRKGALQPQAGLIVLALQDAANTGEVLQTFARSESEAARTHYREGKYRDALDAFRRAYAAGPSTDLLFNLARCHERLSQWAEALAALEKYLEDPNAAERGEVLARTESLKSRLRAPSSIYEQQIDAAHKAYARGDYESAIAAFKSADGLQSSPNVLLNIAKCYERMDRFDEAREYYQLYIRLYPQGPDRQYAEDEFRRLRTETPWPLRLMVTTKPMGAEIFIDDRSAGLWGMTPNHVRNVKPGPHTLILDLDGYESAKREFIMPDNRDLQLDVELRPLENTGMLTISVRPTGVAVLVDGKYLGVSHHLEPRAFTAGRHEITARTGEKSVTKQITIIRGQAAELSFDLDQP